MEEVAKLSVRPAALVENRSQHVPHARHRLDHRQRLRRAEGRIHVDQRAHAIGLAGRDTRDDGAAERKAGEIERPGDVDGVEQLVQLADVERLGERNVGTIGVAPAVVVVAQHAKARVDERCECRIPDVVRHRRAGGEHDEAAVRRPGELIVRVPVAQARELPGRRPPGGVVELETFGIDGEVERRGDQDKQRHEGDAVDEKKPTGRNARWPTVHWPHSP